MLGQLNEGFWRAELREAAVVRKSSLAELGPPPVNDPVRSIVLGQPNGRDFGGKGQSGFCQWAQFPLQST